MRRPNFLSSLRIAGKPRRLGAFACLLVLAGPAFGQPCQASLDGYPDGWRPLQLPAGSATAMRLDVQAACDACKSPVFAEIFAGYASSRFRSMPAAQKTGLAFARSITSEAPLRAAFLADLIEIERRSSPGCEIDGQVDGVAEIGGLGTIVASLIAECDQAPGRIRASHFSGFDGQCQYRIRIMWAGWSPLAPQEQDRVEAFLGRIRFGH